MSHLIESTDKVYTHIGDSRAWHLEDDQLDFSNMTDQEIRDYFNWRVNRETIHWGDGMACIGNQWGIRSMRNPSKFQQLVTTPSNPLQPPELMDWALAVRNRLGGKVSSCGTIKGTSQMWVSLELPNSIVNLGNGDTIKKFLYFTTSWDGSYPTVCIAVDIRTVCWNTTPSIEHVGKSLDSRLWYARGIQSGELKGQEVVVAESFLKYQQANRGKRQRAMEQLTTKHIRPEVSDRTQLRYAFLLDNAKLLNQVIQYQEVEGSEMDSNAGLLDRCLHATIDTQEWDKLRTMDMSAVGKKILHLLVEGNGAAMETAKDTPYGLINGATEAWDHHAGFTGAQSSQESLDKSASLRWTKNIFGKDHQEKNLAILLAAAIANTPALSH